LQNILCGLVNIVDSEQYFSRGTCDGNVNVNRSAHDKPSIDIREAGDTFGSLNTSMFNNGWNTLWVDCKQPMFQILTHQYHPACQIWPSQKWVMILEMNSRWDTGQTNNYDSTQRKTTEGHFVLGWAMIGKKSYCSVNPIPGSNTVMSEQVGCSIRQWHRSSNTNWQGKSEYGWKAAYNWHSRVDVTLLAFCCL